MRVMLGKPTEFGGNTAQHAFEGRGAQVRLLALPLAADEFSECFLCFPPHFRVAVDVLVLCQHLCHEGFGVHDALQHAVEKTRVA